MLSINKISSSSVIDYAAEELKKYLRMMILFLTWLLGIWGFGIGILLFCVFAATNTTLSGKHRYLYPLIPFDKRAFWRLLVRHRKQDVEKKGAQGSDG